MGKMMTLRTILFLSLISLQSLILASPPSGILLQENDVVALCGDSITIMGAYPNFLELYQRLCSPQPKITYHNFGRSGETARTFPPIMDNQILPINPTVALICYGMNNCRSSHRMSDENGESWAKKEILPVINKFREANVRLIVLASPGVIDSTFFAIAQGREPEEECINSTQANLRLLRDKAEILAREEKIVFADMHLSMLDVMTKAKAKYGADYAFAGGKGDGVHPGEAGHLVMAWVYLKALGYDGDIGTFTIDLAQNSATASKDHKIIACQNGKIEIESERYPFCFLPNPYNEKDFTGPRATMSVATLFPFNDDLNRMMLIVKGLKTPKAKVTWGSVSKEFDATQLEAGINLAAEFYEDNPFIPIFKKLSQAMSDLRNVRNLLASPKNKDDTSLIERKKKNEELIQPTPFRHTIEISALP